MATTNPTPHYYTAPDGLTRERDRTGRSYILVKCARCLKLIRKRTHTVACARGKAPKARRLIPCPRCATPFWPWEPRPGMRTSAEMKTPRSSCGCPRVPKPRKVKPEPKSLAPKPCKWCQEPFVGRARYCSDPCLRRATSQRKHIRRRGQRRKAELIPIEEIYQRDGGRCALCYGRVPADFGFKVSYPRAPTLDHIIPLSKGGKHSRCNVQLAHLGCNSGKSNRACGSQLRLSLPGFVARRPAEASVESR